ncbi:flagellar assembly protein FliW [Desulfolucanica intricata]|uniref:flagellar assembly protein FliW n=1 Tax=Desulfolucanica intricata TaxID=1285191 RepID=UPI000830CF48|nr:flagellar assembly protein FliW [Desulfolucanica intricata]
MRIETSRFGSMNIDQEKIISFPFGLPGFEELKHFVLLPAVNMEPFHWMQSAEEPEVAFLAVNPFIFFPDYSFDLPVEDIETLELRSPGEVLILTIITIPGDNIAQTTANLLGPVVINTRLNRAKQVILTGYTYSTRHRLFVKTDKDSHSIQGKEEEKC